MVRAEESGGAECGLGKGGDTVGDGGSDEGEGWGAAEAAMQGGEWSRSMEGGGGAMVA